MAWENVAYRCEDGVGILEIRREQQRNALNLATVREIREVLGSVRESGEARALVITGAGPKAFVAGGDISEIKDLGLKTGLDFLAAGNAMNRDIEALGIPTIAAVNGVALGGGCELAMACALRIAAQNAVFGLPELGLGAIPGFGGTQRLPRLIGRHWALWYMLTGETLDAQRALELGLVHRVVAPEDLMAESTKVARRIAEKAPLAVRAALMAVHFGSESGFESGLALESALSAMTFGSRDKQEGMAAFLEKRKAQYRGE